MGDEESSEIVGEWVKGALGGCEKSSEIDGEREGEDCEAGDSGLGSVCVDDENSLVIEGEPLDGEACAFGEV